LYASEWVERRRHEVDERTLEHWRWALAHVLEHFRDHRPSQITGRLVDQYKVAKLREREELDQAHANGQRRRAGLGPGSINKTLKVLAQVLDDAIEDGYLTENPARGKRRRLKAAKPRRTWLELDEVGSLIDGAGDASGADRDDDPRRPSRLGALGAPLARRRSRVRAAACRGQQDRRGPPDGRP
jgi:integrase